MTAIEILRLELGKKKKELDITQSLIIDIILIDSRYYNWNTYGIENVFQL